MSKIKVVLEEDMFNQGISHFMQWNIDEVPHMAVSGITGIGKTYLVMLILAKVSKYIDNAHITVCDFKGDNNLCFLNGCERFYRFNECASGFNSFYDDFLLHQRNNNTTDFNLLCFDEWSSFLNFLDKKGADEAKKKLSSLLMLGRSYNFHILVSQQRLDAEFFGKSRDNFSCIITLGNPSKEVREMLFSDFKENIIHDRQRGTGYMLINGSEFHKIIVPTISNMELVNQYIRQAVER